MRDFSFLDVFPGVATLLAADPKIALGRVGLIALAFLLIHLGRRRALEPLLMIPMGLGMAAVNAGVLFLGDGRAGSLFVDPLVQGTGPVFDALQINWLQPIYTLTFSNGLIACLVFMGIGVLLDVGFVMARPFQSMILALFAELGTVAVYPIAMAFGLTPRESAAVAMIGGADGPMVLFTSLVLAKHLFVPITVVGYLYLGLTYGGYPYLIKLLVPKRLRGISMPPDDARVASASEKLAFAVFACTLLCLLFPVAAPARRDPPARTWRQRLRCDHHCDHRRSLRGAAAVATRNARRVVAVTPRCAQSAPGCASRARCGPRGSARYGGPSPHSR
ncbi:MAG: sodium ion-translocating decarboxylase subunit beta [Proteobacteria bacterium]|nr:sodium ion-translocating decarboxylase subunit beta [Pseudomonadota bacterium]